MTAAESFARLTWRITEGLIGGELTRDEYVTLVYLVAKFAHDLYMKPADERLLVTELAVIKAETSYPKGTPRLRQVIESLVEKGWLGTRTVPGSSKWEIWPTGAAIVEKNRDPAKGGAQGFEVASKRQERPERATLDAERDSAAREARNDEGPLEVDVEVEKDLLREEESEGLSLGLETERAEHLEIERANLELDGADLAADAPEDVGYGYKPAGAKRAVSSEDEELRALFDDEEAWREYLDARPVQRGGGRV